MSTSARKYESGPWDQLDADLEASCVDAPKGEEEAVKRALGLQMVSIRLQPELIEVLKEIASYHGIGYQPMIRDLLNRFATSEIKDILSQRIADAQRKASGEEETVPVSQFLDRERKTA